MIVPSRFMGLAAGLDCNGRDGLPLVSLRGDAYVGAWSAGRAAAIALEQAMPATGRFERVRLGRTSLEVSRICFGTGARGAHDAISDEVVRAIFDGPANFLDTSRNYGRGGSEQTIGRVTAERGGLPDGFVLATKIDRDFETNVFDRARARRSLEESMAALGLDHIPLMHLHDPQFASTPAEIDGAIAELFKMKEEGLIDATGLGIGPMDVLMPLLREWDFDAMMTNNQFTLVNRHAEDAIEFALAKGTAVLNGAPYAGGVLAKGPASYPRYVYQEMSEAVLEPIRAVEAVCARHGVPTGAAALQFSMRDSRITSTVVGVTQPERIAQTLEWARWPIAQQAWEELTSLPYAVEKVGVA